MIEMVNPYEDLIRNAPLGLFSLLSSILFIQSGLDKGFNFSENMEWLKGHFAKTFLSPMTPVMVVTITILEVVAGLGTAFGLVYFVATGSAKILFCASLLGALTLLALFFGQRVAKDYPGAAVIVPYFIVQVIMVAMTGQHLVYSHAP